MNCINNVTAKQDHKPSILLLAESYLVAGVSIIPIRLDGSKAPAISSWKEYATRLPTQEELDAWFGSRRVGIGIVCGIVSQGLEVLDFDDGSLFMPWFDSVPNIAAKLIVVETPSDGYHVIYRCSEIGGNRKIAIDPSREKQTLIETRGEGGYIVGVGSPLGVHPRNDRTYVQVMGPEIPAIPTITPPERTELWRAARQFTKAPIVLPKPTAATTPLRIPSGPAEQVIDQFNRCADWQSILDGWTSRDGIHWTRPGKVFGVSAKVCEAGDGTPLLSVFSSNAGALTPDTARAGKRQDIQSYSKFEALVRLRFRGDRKAAFKAIKEGQV